MIPLLRGIELDESEIEWSYIHASGPGGQHVNKTASAAQLRFDLAGSLSLSDPARQLLLEKLKSALTPAGVLIITAQRFRSQPRNRQDALERLVAMLQSGLKVPRPRKATRATLASRERRIDTKRKRSTIKAQRRDSGADRD